MADFGSKLTSYAKSEAQNFAQKTVNKLSGQLSNLGGGVVNSLIGSVAQGLSQNLLDIGAAFDTIEAVAAQKVDGLVAGGSSEFASGGKCADRATQADISSMRNSSSENLKKYSLSTFPDTRISESVSSFNTSGVMNLLTETSDKYYMTMRFYKYDRADLFKPSTQNSNLYTVSLPLPLELQESYSTDFDTPSTGILGNIMNQWDQVKSGTIPESVKVNLLRSGAETLAGGFDSILNAGGTSAQGMFNAIEQYLGVAPNPNPAYMFKGPRLRDFTFSWFFNPRNKEESARIKKAIQKMKASSLPSNEFGTDTGILRYPHILMPNFYPWDKGSNVSNGGYGWSDNSLLRIKRSVISNISSNYAPTGAPVFFAGSNDPVYIQLSISLKEIEFSTANDIDSSIENGTGDLTDRFNQMESDLTGALTNLLTNYSRDSVE